MEQFGDEINEHQWWANFDTKMCFFIIYKIEDWKDVNALLGIHRIDLLCRVDF